jgi:hypothetical protein
VWLHEFQPGRCISGLVLVTAGALYVGDAAGEWEVPWFVAIPLVTCGFFLAAMAGLTARLVRGGRRDPSRSDAGDEGEGDSGSGSGSGSDSRNGKGDAGGGPGEGAHLAG